MNLTPELPKNETQTTLEVSKLIETNLKNCNINEAFANFNQLLENISNYKNPLINLQSQWSEIEIQKRNGTITDDFHSLRFNQIDTFLFR
jgi:hypothetical protein